MRHLNVFWVLIYINIFANLRTFKSITVAMHMTPITVSPALILSICFNRALHMCNKFPPPPLTPIRSFICDMMMRMAAADVKPEHTGTDIKLTINPRPAKLISAWMTPVRKHNSVAYTGPRLLTVLFVNNATMAVGPIATTLLVPNNVYMKVQTKEL